MSYATINDVFRRYPPISTAVGTGEYDVASVDVDSTFIAGAEGMVNGFLSARYTVPLPSDPLITRLTADIAIYDILAQRLPEMPDFMQTRYDQALKMLGMIRDGKMSVNSATIVTTGDWEAYSTTMGFHGIFSPVLDAECQIPDSGRVEQDGDEREDDWSATC